VSVSWTKRVLLFKALPLSVLLLTISCSRAPSAAEANRLLAGRWKLVIGQDCRGNGIKSDVLFLHGDGRLEQHFLSDYGQRFVSTDERWSYVPDDSINFDMRKDFLHRQPPNEAVGVSIHETLLVEFGNPAIILLNPDGNCFYQKVGND
jgi:hypothetical protein